MSFFGFESSKLEQEKKKFLEGGLQESEDLAVYTWGEESYDGLGDALLEGGDELNDETFGGTDAVGKDFDFMSHTLPTPIGGKHGRSTPAAEPFRERMPLVERTEPASHDQGFSSAPKSLESIWDDKSPFSMLPRVADHQRTPSNLISSFPISKSPALNAYADNRPLSQQQHNTHRVTQTGVRTLQEIEAEMRVLQKRKQQEDILMQAQRQELQREEELHKQEEFLREQLERQDLQRFQQEQLLAERMRVRLEQEQQLRLQQQARMSTPRVVSHLPLVPSPRFNQQHQHQQQILLLQQEQERQQQERLKELQERLRMEEIERQLRAQQLSQLQQAPNLLARRQSPYTDTQRRTHSPAFESQYALLNQQNAQYLPQSIQLQQRLLSEMAQVEFMRDMQGISQAEQEALRVEAMRKIMETERMEEKRRRKAAKIAHMSRYNDLMTQSDKDFITRIQVSQLVTQDPYAEDFYAQVYGAILRSRMGLQSQDERVIKFGSSGGVGLGLAQKGSGRRQSAMQKMEAQVERIVNNARLREKEKGLHSLHSLQGALGKTSGRSYKAAPRQLLQVDASSATPTMSGTHPHISKDVTGAAQEAAKLGREALGQAAGSDGVVRKEPLTQRQTLVLLEGLYDLVLNIEQLRRDQPPEEDEEDEEAFAAWSTTYNDLIEQMWMSLKVMVPLETSDPHPFVSLLTPVKGKRLLPRLSRHIAPPRMLTLLTLLVACFSQLDVVKHAPLLDSLEETPERQDVEQQTQAFLGSVLQSILPVVAKAELRVITGLLGLLLDRTNIVVSAQTRPGIAMLTLFLSRVEIVKQGMSSAQESSEIPTPEEAQQWQTMFDHLFQLLMSHFVLLFPSTRLAAQPLPVVAPLIHTDILDQPVWQFLAALALHASPDQQSILVTSLREKVLDIVTSVNKGWVADEEERQTKLANVNLFLHALGLDSSQISV